MIDELLEQAVLLQASDVHLTVGLPPVFRINGELRKTQRAELSNADTFQMADELMDTKRHQKFLEFGEADFSYTLPDGSRFRVNVFRQSSSIAIVIRLINKHIPTLQELKLPKIIAQLALMPRGLVLVTGPTGSGKSTTLAAMIDYINRERNEHIITLEDPIEYKHTHINSIINQREVNSDTKTFANGLRAALREDPDVILVGEMRDAETIATAITAAETGHLVLATLHTSDAAQTVNRIIDVFPEHQQMQIRIQLAGNLQGIVTQQLLITKERLQRVPAFEILIATPALRNLIRESKTHQIPSYIQTGSKFGMQSMDASLAELVRHNVVEKELAASRCVDYSMFERLVQGF
ncbi:MAG TPA: type IV pilus twitching motility protein PilT [Candidatus Avacidaminococcus intestinavium]|uniref:Type IV pilus twitching motility protein PilT n=1 Tax=Candidatus Avacidaminococcus intestinavium TaxID=2840684 RepID=A0A9D1MNS8_9FIRM|nr:type IV pilus twitching motility protein PilT [Candidatus Avacidaminococcus intestinavium]